jgi:hypothetical protein
MPKNFSTSYRRASMATVSGKNQKLSALAEVTSARLPSAWIRMVMGIRLARDDIALV